MHRLETRYELIFSNHNRPVEGKYASDAWGAEQVYNATIELRHRNWKELDKISKVYLTPCNQEWYIGKERHGELYQIATLPMIDVERSGRDYLAIIIAARRANLPFRAYAKIGRWEFWREYDTRYRRQAELEQLGPPGKLDDTLGDAGTAVASASSLGFMSHPSFRRSADIVKSVGAGKDQGESNGSPSQDKTSVSVEDWGTSHIATARGMSGSRMP